ncbi:hypothetical protein EDD86DRAFT_3524 [Gorgonomyces haynaldii]|nr:hypothetical protein EDD86DRAFT_3524 [Gorgonomyces haynaldii]
MSKANLLLPSIVTAEAPFKSMGDFLDAEEQQLALKMGKALSNDSVGKSTERRGSLSNERLASSTSLNSRRMSLQSDRRQSFTGERRQSLVSQVLSKASSRRTSLHDSAASNWQLGESEWPMLDQIATVIPPVLVHDMEESYMDPDNIKKKLTGIISSAYAEIEALDEHVADITTRLRLQESTPHHESMDLLVGSERMLNIPLEQEPEKIEQQVPHFVEEAIFPSINHAKLGRFARDKEALSFIVQAMQSNPFVQHFRLKRHWTDCAKSKKSQSILVYSFWYVWHNFWKSEDKQIMDELSDLISSNYVDLLVKFKGNIKQKEEFFKMYPDLISQALHFAFVDNFPNSRSLLTNDFKNGMYDVIFHLLCGLHPSIMVCEAWSRPNDVNVQGSGSRINKAGA